MILGVKTTEEAVFLPELALVIQELSRINKLTNKEVSTNVPLLTV